MTTRFTIFILLAAFIVGYKQSFAQKKEIPGALVHTVLFWLKDPDNESDRKTFKNAVKEIFSTNPQIIAVHLGTPATTENRPEVDNSFTYCYTLTFDSVEAEKAYQIDETHVKFVRLVEPILKKVVVYDSFSILNREN